MRSRPAPFVVDTHALWWYLTSPQLLSADALTIFRRAEAGNAKLIVPAIVVAELYFVSVKLRQPMPPALLRRRLTPAEWIEFPTLGWEQAELLDTLTEIPDIHDRLIAAEAFLRNAPLITRDPILAASPNIATIW